MHEIAINHTGFHSTVTSGALKSKETYFRKAYGEAAQGFDLHEAAAISWYIQRFYRVAQEIGVSAAAPFGFYLEDNRHAGKVNLVEVVKSAGADLKTVFSNPKVSDSQVIAYTREYLSQFKLVWNAGFPIALDPPPANFCLNSLSKIHYVDGMPPRQRLPNGTLISEWPVPSDETRPFIEARYFSPLQARVIYAQLLRGLATRNIPPLTIRTLMGTVLGTQAYELVMLTPEQKIQVITNPQPTDVDLIRIIAAEAAYEKSLSSNEVKAIYAQCHIIPGGILPESAQLKQATSHLARALFSKT